MSRLAVHLNDPGGRCIIKNLHVSIRHSVRKSLLGFKIDGQPLGWQVGVLARTPIKTYHSALVLLDVHPMLD